ncbi:MAG: OsmC family protein [Candidatus Dormibacteraceae bacterium]
MDRERLRAAQSPIKERYRREPEAALVVLRASGALDGDDIACSVETGRALVEAGLHPATGGSGALACSGDMLLQALVACAGVTLRSVATSLEIPVSGTVRVEGDLDFRGTLGIAKDGEAPVGFSAIRLSFDLQGVETDEQLERLLRLTERYCVVYQTLAKGVPVTISCQSDGS